MTKTERTIYLIHLDETVMGAAPYALTRGDVDRLVALARVTGGLSLMAEVLRPGFDTLEPGPERDWTLVFAEKIRRAVFEFDRAHLDQYPDLEARVAAAQTALSDLQPERL